MRLAGAALIDYESAAHGGNLSPESHAIYKKIHQELMKGDVEFAESLRAAVRNGVFDFDPKLRAHFVDVMG